MSQSENIKVTAAEVKAQTIDRRRLHHGTSGSSPELSHTPDLSGPSGPHSCWLPTVVATALAESLDKPFPWAVGFFFGNTELSLELWTVTALSSLPP